MGNCEVTERNHGSTLLVEFRDVVYHNVFLGLVEAIDL